jgi:ATP-dependent Clp protease adaptor protein ClpS
MNHETGLHKHLQLDLSVNLSGARVAMSTEKANQGETATLEPKFLTSRPPMYKVLLLNDDYTPMDFVVHILQKFFQKSYDEAMQVMLAVHQLGVGVAGTFSREIAETKVTQVNEYSKSCQHPLKATMEKA